MTRVGEDRAWLRTLGAGLMVFAISRVIVLAGVYARAVQELTARQARNLPVESTVYRTMQRVLTQWDGKWYEMIAAQGYPRQLPERITYVAGDSATVAFFPAYPLLGRAFDIVVPGGLPAALLAVNLLLSALAVLLVGTLARRYYDTETAALAMTLLCLYPGSAVMSWSYSEPLLIVCAAACLLLLDQQRWELAGLAAAVATATRPNGLALVAVCAVAAAIAIRRHRQWRALAAVVLAPLGAVAFFVFLRQWTGEPNAWMRAQRDAWNEGYAWGMTAYEYTRAFVESPLRTVAGATYFHTVVALVSLAFGGWCAWRVRLPLLASVYSLGIAFFMLVPREVNARPRFVLTAFPLAIAVAAWWPRQRTAREGLLILSAGSLVAFTVLYASYGAIP